MNYKNNIKLIVVLIFILSILIIISAGLGYINLPFFNVFKIILSKFTGNFKDIENTHFVIVMDVRLPRILVSSIVGAGLSLAGVVFQGILLNPLADPYTLGVSAGAAFGASIGIIFNINFFGIYSVSIFAFIGAVITLFLVIFLSSGGADGISSNSLILSGIIVSQILSAGISFCKYLANEQVSIIIFWLMGSFASKTWGDVSITFIILIIGFCVFMFYSRDLNLLSLGEKSASSLGVNIKQTTLILLITASLVSAVCVAVSGIIGFVGLLVPHMTRALIGPDNQKLIPVSMLFGAILLLSADTVIRAILPTEIPIGVLTALIGGPLFCYIFWKRYAFSN